MSLSADAARLFLLATPVAAVAWTITHEEIFREAHDWCVGRSKRSRHWYERKFFYLFTCEYCFSHYVALFFLLLARYKLILPDWRGYVIGLFALVWVANVYMSIFGRLRLGIKRERVEVSARQEEIDKTN